MVEYEILVLLPSGDNIVRDSVEDLPINLGLRRSKRPSVTLNKMMTCITYVVDSARHPNMLPKLV